MIARFWFVFMLSFFTISAVGQNNIQTYLQELLANEKYKDASVGILVADLLNGDELVALNPDKLLIPASTMKLITSATALKILGPEYQFSTGVAYSGFVDKNGELHGDVVLKGGADPALGSEYFRDHYYNFLQKWVKSIKEAGIRTVNGNLVLDGSVYDSEKVPATWIWEDLGNYYGAGASAFTVYDNLFRITFQSPKKADKATRIISYYPKIEGLMLKNEVLSSNENKDNAYVFGGPLDKERVIRGTIPTGRNAFTIKASIQQPGEILAADFRNELSIQGIFIKGEIRFAKVSDKDLQTVYLQESPTLQEITKVLNYESVNLFAEHLLKQLAVEKYGVGDRNKAIEIVQDFWKQKFPDEHFFMEDGSGLSHFDAVTPRFFVRLLTFMDENEAFVHSLPVAGEGTLSGFDKKLFQGNTLQAKSGSMTRVRCYSGYLTTDSGRKLVFSVMFNHFSGSHSELIHEIEKLFYRIKSEE